MTRALVAASKAQLRAALDRFHLDHNEKARLLLALAAESGARAGIDRRGLHTLLDDHLAADAVEGTNHAGGQ